MEKKANLLKRIGKRLLIYIVLFYFLLSLAIYFKQDSIVFIPTQGPPFETPTSLKLGFEDLRIKSADYDIHAWYIPADANRGTVLFCHGNAGNLGDRMNNISIWNRLGMNILVFDYRGYGLSQGTTTEEGCYEDVEACYKWLQMNNRIQKPFIVHGRSLGGGVASWAAENLNFDGLILESTFTSIPAMGQYRFPFLPISLISNIYFPTAERISNITCPIQFFHSNDDEVVPYFMGEQLAKSATVELQLLKGGHNSAYTFTNNYSEKLNEFILRIKKSPVEP